MFKLRGTVGALLALGGDGMGGIVIGGGGPPSVTCLSRFRGRKVKWVRRKI